MAPTFRAVDAIVGELVRAMCLDDRAELAVGPGEILEGDSP